MPTPQTGRHLANDVEPEVVQALRDAVVAPAPGSATAITSSSANGWGWTGCRSGTATRPCRWKTSVIDWPTAREMVMAAYTGFDPRMGELAEPFFEVAGSTRA